MTCRKIEDTTALNFPDTVTCLGGFWDLLNVCSFILVQDTSWDASWDTKLCPKSRNRDANLDPELLIRIPTRISFQDLGGAGGVSMGAPTKEALSWEPVLTHEPGGARAWN